MGTALGEGRPAARIPAGDPQIGAELAALGACASCHTAEGGEPYAGGYALQTPFGTFYGPNLSSDLEHGLGAWSFQDFVRAMRRGRSPDGEHYYPAFPYPSYTMLSEDDLAHLWAWLSERPPIAQPDLPHELKRFKRRGPLALWKLLELKRGPAPVEPALDPELARGRYLVEAVGHCGECHTPRNRIGGTRERHELAGSDADPEPGPNITPHAEGLASWTVEDWQTFLSMAMTPEGDFVGGEMGRVVTEGTAPLSEADRRAIARWMVDGVEPRPDP